MGKKEDWWDDVERDHRGLKWIANVDKDDPSVSVKGHVLGPPRAEDQFSAEELSEMGVVGIYGKVRKDKKP